MYRFKIVGLRRSGNHAIISWLAYHFNNERVLFFNDIDPDKEIFSSQNIKKYNRKVRLLKNYEPFVKIKLSEEYNDCDCLIHSYEERDILDLPNHDKTILIVRDPYNVTASRIKSLESNKPKSWFPIDNGYISKTIQYLEEALGKTNYLKNKIVINYNKWFVSRDYRKSLSVLLGLNFKDEGFLKMLPHGGGSSFVNDDLKPLERWKEYKDNILFKKILKIKQIEELSIQFFGEIIQSTTR